MTSPNINPAELAVQDGLTQWFIEAKSWQFTLTPRTRVRKDNGGWAWVNGTPRGTQTLRLIEQVEPQLVRTDGGIERTITHQLLGGVCSEMEKGDFFVSDGETLEVLELLPFNGYEKRALITRQLTPPA